MSINGTVNATAEWAEKKINSAQKYRKENIDRVMTTLKESITTREADCVWATLRAKGVITEPEYNEMISF